MNTSICSLCSAEIDAQRADYSSEGELICPDCAVKDADADKVRTRLQGWASSALAGAIISLLVNPAGLISLASAGVAARALWAARAPAQRDALGEKRATIMRIAASGLAVGLASSCWAAYSLWRAWQRGASGV